MSHVFRLKIANSLVLPNIQTSLYDHSNVAFRQYESSAIDFVIISTVSIGTILIYLRRLPELY